MIVRPVRDIRGGAVDGGSSVEGVGVGDRDRNRIESVDLLSLIQEVGIVIIIVSSLRYLSIN